MPKRVLNVGQCSADHGSIMHFLKLRFDVEIDRTHALDDTLDALRDGTYDLVLVNRQLDRGGEGMDVLRTIKEDPQLRATPVMLVSDFADAQEAAVAAGAESGFGKSEYNSTTAEKLAAYLG